MLTKPVTLQSLKSCGLFLVLCTNYSFKILQVVKDEKTFMMHCDQHAENAVKMNLKDIPNDHLMVYFTKEDFHEALRTRNSTVSKKDIERIDSFNTDS